MGKDPKEKEKEQEKEALSKVYREFSRQKYNKYKLQFPKMRESEIVSKIIKEWDTLDLVAKNNLKKIYQEKKYLTSEDISSSEALMRAEQSRKNALSASKNVVLATASKTDKFTPTRILPAQQRPKSDSDYQRGGSQHQIDSKIDSSSPALVVGAPKTKAITKTSYATFLKYYFESLSKSHPRWTATQISTVIRLMWRKRKNLEKQKKVLARQNILYKRKVSGFRFYRLKRGLVVRDAKLKWKTFPTQTRKYWVGVANHYEQKADNTNVLTKRLKCPSETSIQESNTPFGYMNKH